MKRRAFIAGLASAAAWPVVAWAQQSNQTRRIGVLMGFAENDPEAQSNIAAFRQALQKLGWTGGNVRISYRWVAGNAARMRTFASEVVALQPDVVFAATTPALAALRRETRTVPIVFVQVSDPVRDGFIDNLANPSGNVTGFSGILPSLGGKWVQLLKEIAPRLTRVTVMFNPATAPGGGSEFFRGCEVDGSRIGIKVSAAHVHDVAGIEHAIGEVARETNGGLIIPPDIFLAVNRQPIIGLTARYRVPVISQYRYLTVSGGLMSYGIDVLYQYTSAAEYIDRLLKGTKLSNLPVQTPTKYELVINLKTAMALGLDMPPTLLIRADEVIE